jgi:hypothetical protein
MCGQGGQGEDEEAQDGQEQHRPPAGVLSRRDRSRRRQKAGMKANHLGARAVRCVTEATGDFDTGGEGLFRDQTAGGETGVFRLKAQGDARVAHADEGPALIVAAGPDRGREKGFVLQQQQEVGDHFGLSLQGDGPRGRGEGQDIGGRADDFSGHWRYDPI